MKRTILILVFFIAQFLCAQTAIAPSGSGTSGSPYQIASLENIYWITQNSSSWSSYFQQTADIDASSSSTWASGGFPPIGNSTINFTGSYDGQGHTINGIYISRSTTNQQGLFGYTYGGSIINLGLTNVNVTGQNYVGALVGYWTFNTKVNNCYSTGSVSGSAYIGGLAGFIFNTSFSPLEYCYSTCSVSTSGSFAGGLVGDVNQLCSIHYCYSTGNVNCGSYYAGGLVGGHELGQDTMNCCYSTGNITASTNYAGGFLGAFTNSYFYIMNCYCLGNVTRSSGSSTGFGGFIGFSGGTYFTMKYCYSTGSVNFGTTNGFMGYVVNAQANVYTSNFFDTQTSGKTTGTGATGNTTANMKTQSTFTGWDFTTVWQMNGVNYPDLRAIPNFILPVELTSFKAFVIGNNIELNWCTSTEVNNYGYEVQKSSVQNSDWIKSGFVNGSGNSNTTKSYSFSENNLQPGKYYYRLKQIDKDGGFAYSNTIEVNVTSEITEFSLQQNYPNPFNPTTIINYSLAKEGNVRLTVYNAIGSKVATIINGYKPAGNYSVQFNGSNLASGIYLYRLESGNYNAIKKFILMK